MLPPLLLTAKCHRVGEELLKELEGLLRSFRWIIEPKTFLLRDTQVAPEPLNLIQQFSPAPGRCLDQMVKNMEEYAGKKSAHSGDP